MTYIIAVGVEIAFWRSPMTNNSSTPPKGITVSDEDNLVQSLKKHGQVKETVDPDAKLDPGQTHLLIKKPGQRTGILVEKRKSFF
jgi:hypothetical protein